MALDGIKVCGVSAGISQSDIKVYFSNPKNGGGRVSKIFFPLLNHTAVVIFADRNVIQGITSRRHKIKNCDVRVERLPKNIFSKVSVELEPEITQMLDQNSSYLEVLQFDGELDVNFDPDSMNYIMIGNWYQVEWAWNYLESVSKETTTHGCLSQSDDHQNKSNMLSSTTPNIPSGRGSSRASSSESVQKNFPDTTRKQSNIAWNIKRQEETNISVPYQPFKSNIPQTVDRLEQRYKAEHFQGTKRSEVFQIGGTNQKKMIGTSDAHIPLLDNPLRGRDMWTSNYPHHDDFDSDNTDDELAASYLDDRSSSPEMFVPARHIPRPRGPSPKGTELLHSDFGDMPLTFDAFIGGMQVKVVMGDIVKERSDAIVNPTNQTMSHSYGISAAIARMAGRGLIDECRNHITRNGPLEVAQVTKTCAGGALDSQVDFVLHTVPPTWREHEVESTSHILTCTYLNCLQVANKQLWLRSLSLPIIGAGGLGIPLDVSVQALFDAVHLHVSDEQKTSHLQSVQLVSNTQDSTCSVIVVLRSLLDLDQGESQNGAIDRYLTRSKEFNFRAKDCYLDQEKQDRKVKGGDEKCGVSVVDERKLASPVEQMGPYGASLVTNEGPEVQIMKNRGDDIRRLGNQDDDANNLSNRGQGVDIQQGRVDSLSKDHQARGNTKLELGIDVEGENSHIFQDKYMVDLGDEPGKEKISGFWTKQVPAYPVEEETTEDDTSRKSIQTREVCVESQRHDQLDEFVGGDDDFTYKVDTVPSMLEKAKESTLGKEVDDMITHHGEDSDNKTGITDNHTLSVNDSEIQKSLTAGNDVAQSMPSCD
ncbi:uncharacterized protein LOC110440580 [Mizuhopecten yessoensis]|uniref:Macro domain-containing protein n=1 Tax=Mizuhopecten yessoensis TaxID=6573 RepID=A0A210R171_MIZYE|nr:uncharacterized protein LOC110440580 [Mizuhopecten yessoensis]OWF54778.1 hypothetical protein KP79_PYT21863 [Mizuhopecten yessoensis]